MALDHARGAITPPAAPSLSTRAAFMLHGRWLLLARIAFAAFSAAVLWISLTTYLRAILAPEGFVSARLEGLGETREALAHLGIPFGAYLAATLGMHILSQATYLSAALLLFRRRSREVSALLVAIFLLAPSAAEFPGNNFARFTAEPARAVFGLFVTYCWAVTFVLLFYLFPDGRFTPRWTVLPAVAWAVWLGWVFFIYRSFDSMGLVFDALPFVIVFTSIVAAQIYRYRRVSGPVERQQSKWFLGALGLNLAAFFIGNVLLGAVGALDEAATGDRVMLAWTLFEFTTGLMGLCVPIALAVAVLRYRLFAIDVIINRALVYGGLTAAVIATYVLVVGYLGSLFRTGGNLAISLVATGIVAVLFQPLRQWLQRGANRLLYGERDEPYAVISRLGRRLEGTLTPDAILPTIVETVAGALKLPYAAIALGTPHQPTIAAATGTPIPNPVRLPLAYQGEPVGEFLLAPRAPGEPFSPADRRLLDDLARQAGVAAQAVRLAHEARQLATDLQASRERLVLAREEERRRLRRDLHDGLGPRLAALTLRLDTARDTLADDPRADALLGDLADRTEEAVADIRRLVYALRPPALDDLGLTGAIRQAADGYGPGPLHIAFEIPDDLSPLPAAVEVAAYRIATEALTNVVRHARASHCTIRLTLDGTHAALVVEVVDNGRGIAPDWEAGFGTASMRERAEELGGICIIEPMPSGGTRVHVTLPCRPADGQA